MNTTFEHGTAANAATLVAQLKHETLPLESLKLPPHMPKKVGDKAVQSLMRAMHRTGQQLLPVMVDDGNAIVAGFEIATALRELGVAEVGVVRLSSLTPAETKAIMLLLAKIPEQSSWDEAAVAAIIEEISIDDPDALDITGFDVAEIDIALGTHDLSSDEAEFVAAASHEEPEEVLHSDQPASVQQGDLFQLGRHRVLCGDSLSMLAYDILMDGEYGAAAVTDPPYNIPIAGNVSGLGEKKHGDFTMAVGEMNFDQFTSFLKSFVGLTSMSLRDGALLYIFMDRRHLEELMRAIRELDMRLVDVAIWNKLSGGMGGLYRSQHEPCLVTQVGNGPLTNNVQLGKFGRNRTNVWDFRGFSSFGKDRNEALAAHPTVKPWAMLAEIILDCSKRGDIVLDPFLGSGSTLLAAEKVKRHCYGIEIEPSYVEAAIQRWERMTGQKAVHIPSGLTLQELREERQASATFQIAAPGANEEANP